MHRRHIRRGRVIPVMCAYRTKARDEDMLEVHQPRPTGNPRRPLQNLLPRQLTIFSVNFREARQSRLARNSTGPAELDRPSIVTKVAEQIDYSTPSKGEKSGPSVFRGLRLDQNVPPTNLFPSHSSHVVPVCQLLFTGAVQPQRKPTNHLLSFHTPLAIHRNH